MFLIFKFVKKTPFEPCFLLRYRYNLPGIGLQKWNVYVNSEEQDHTCLDLFVVF